MIRLPTAPPVTKGDWKDADAVRRWSFARRTPAQRLGWLIEMLEIGYRTGAFKPGPRPAVVRPVSAVPTIDP